MDIDHGYIEDTVRELLDELHDYLTDDFVKGKPVHIQEELKQVRERHRPFLGNLTPDDIKLIEDFSPKLFDTYNGKAPLKDVMRGFIDVFYQYRMIYSNHHLGSIRYELEPKYNENKSYTERIELLKSRLKEVYALIGGDVHPLDEEVQALLDAIQKAYANPERYLKPKKVKKPSLNSGFRKWLLSLPLPGKQEMINEFLIKL